mgnify:CR=1 FL=1
MRNQLIKAIGKIDTGVTRLKAYSSTTPSLNNSNLISAQDTRKSTATDRFPNIGATSSFNLN